MKVAKIICKNRFRFEIMSLAGFYKLAINGEVQSPLYTSVHEAEEDIPENKTYKTVHRSIIERLVNGDIDFHAAKKALMPYSYFYYDEYENIDDFTTTVYTLLDYGIMSYNVFCNLMDGASEYFGEDWR